jgi:hypothetical protein
MQPNENSVAFDLQAHRHGKQHTDRDVPDTRDRTIAELKSQVTFLPQGYRVVATASDAWVLVARGARVSGYRGILDPEEAARDAWEHQKRNR